MIVDFLLSILGVLLTIFIVVGVHEGAHFLVARLLGIKVLRCSIGFGKALCTWRDKKGTEYVLAPFPLGGYVKLLDENEGPVSEAEKPFAFNRQPLYKRVAVVAAGPLSNLIVAVLLYWVIFLVGFKTPLPLIGTVDPHSIASEAGLKAQQEIVSVDGHLIHSWSGVIMRLIVHAGDQDTVTIQAKNFNPARATELRSYTLNLAHWHMNELTPDPLSSLGINPYMPEIPLVIGKMQDQAPVTRSPLKIGDKILALNGKAVKTWDQLIHFIDKNPGKKILIKVRRKQQQLVLPVELGYQRDFLLRKHGFLGVSPDFELPDNLLHSIQYGPLSAISAAFQETVQLSYLNLLLFGKLITHKLSLYSLGGPITIFQSAGSAFLYGILAFMGFLAFLNVALGVINFFPIPGLDGGHLFFFLVEAVLQRPLSLRVQVLCYRVGFIFLILILVQALTNDLLRITN